MMNKPKRSLLQTLYEKKSLGTFGEISVAEHLIKKGYQILSRNFRTRRGEIDIIARKKNLITFVEVKLRKKSWHCTSEIISWGKQQKIIAAASSFIAQMDTDEHAYRFDVALVNYQTTTPSIEHIENAFYGNTY